MRCLKLILLVVPVIAAPSRTLEKRQATGCTLPSGYTPATNSNLPDPFTFANGTKLTSKSQISCRQDEITQMFEQWELGTKPPKPSSVTASYASNAITVTCSEGGKSISFTAKISYPSSGKGPFPAIIGIGGSSIPIPADVAQITFDNDGMAAEQSPSSHGTGLFFNLYGSSANAGALIAWAWGVSRLIDALEITPSANIDTTRLGVTGCSRDAKGAFIVGAFDNRIALTIPQESGSGGAACWRISDSQHAAGKNIQTASEIVTENAWFSPVFNQYADSTSTLPHDHHFLAALTWPRGLFVIENDIDWLGPVSTTGCMEIGQLIYQALGNEDAFGFTCSSPHTHCSFPSSQQADLTTFITTYLVNKSNTTSLVQNSDKAVTLNSYYSWTVPNLS